MGRLDDLMATMPARLEAAIISPPVEIAVVDYNSPDDLQAYMGDLIATTGLPAGSFISYRKYFGRSTYHAAHANNLAMTFGLGAYLVLVPADIYLGGGYLPTLRALIADGCVWANTARKNRSTIAVSRGEFYECGGYDERMEMYGPDDVDLIERLTRRGGKHGTIPDEMVGAIYTTPEKKVANYRLKLSHKELGKLSLPFLEQNRAEEQLVANAGREWGQW